MDIVWFAEIKWDYLRTRKQQLIRRLPPGHRLVFLEPYVRGKRNVFDLRERDGIRVATVPFLKSIPAGPARALLELRPFRAAVDAYAYWRVRKLLGEAGMVPEESVFMISNVFAIGVAERFRRRRLIYDCNDAHAAFPGMPAWTREYQAETCRRADGVVVTSEKLEQDVSAMRGGRDGVVQIGNGVEYGHFARVRAERSGVARGAPCVGYLGAIAPWFDFEMVSAMAKERPDWKVALVGPVLGGAEMKFERLRALPNVEYRPSVSYDLVPEVLSVFDVGLIPFRRDDLTRGVNPNKMYEYLAMGLPVVATRFSPEVERYPELVDVVDNARGLVAACDRFVGMRADAERLARFRVRADDVAAEHDWDHIAAAFWHHVGRVAG